MAIRLYNDRKERTTSGGSSSGRMRLYSDEQRKIMDERASTVKAKPKQQVQQEQPQQSGLISSLVSGAKSMASEQYEYTKAHPGKAAVRVASLPIEGLLKILTKSGTDAISAGIYNKANKKIRKQEEESNKKLLEAYKRTNDPEKKARIQELLKQSSQQIDVAKEAPSINKTALQIAAEAGEAVVDVATLGFGGPAIKGAKQVGLQSMKLASKKAAREAAELGAKKLAKKTAAKRVSKVIGGGTGLGTVYGGLQPVQEGETDPRQIAKSAGVGAIAGTVLAGGLYGGTKAFGKLMGKVRKAKKTPQIDTAADAGFTSKAIGEKATEVIVEPPKSTPAMDYINKNQNRTNFRVKPTGTKTVNVHHEDIAEMKQFVEYAKDTKTGNKEYDIAVGNMAKHYGINPNQTHKQLANDFDYILSQHNLKYVDVDHPVNIELPKQRTPSKFTKDERGQFTGSKSRKTSTQKLGDVKETDISKLNSIDRDRPSAIKDFKAGKVSQTDLPVLARKEADGTYTVLDGNGRIVKAQSEGKSTVPMTTNEAEYRKLTEDTTKFRLKDDYKTATGITVSDAQEKVMIDRAKKYFGDDVDVKVMGKILTPKGQEALGSYRGGMIKILNGQADPLASLDHEAVHAFLDIFSTKNEYANILEVAQKHYGIDDFAKVDEKLAEDFIKYTKTREGVVGQIRAHFDNVLEKIKVYFGNEDEIKKLYSDIYTGQAKTKLEGVKSYKEQIALVQEAVNAGDTEAAKAIYKGIEKTDYLPKFDDVVKNAKQKQFAGALSEQMAAREGTHATMKADRDLLDDAIGAENVDNIKRILKTKYAQESDFDVTKIKGFDDLADTIKRVKNKPELTESEVLDMIKEVPTRSEIKAFKPTEVAQPKDLEIIEPGKVEEIAKINEAGGEVTKVPSTQLPIGEGKEKVSKLAARVQGVTGKATPEEIERLGLRTYNQMNNKDAIAKSAELVTKNWDDGLKVLEGKINPPAGTNEGSIYVAMTQLAKDDSSGKLATDLMGLKATAMGQNIEILKELDKNNPVKHIDDLVKRTIEAKGGDKKIKTARVSSTKQLKPGFESTIKKSTPTRQSWGEFIASIRC